MLVHMYVTMYVIRMCVRICMHAIFLCTFVRMIISKYAHMCKCYPVYYVANFENLACMYI